MPILSSELLLLNTSAKRQVHGVPWNTHSENIIAASCLTTPNVDLEIAPDINQLEATDYAACTQWMKHYLTMQSTSEPHSTARMKLTDIVLSERSGPERTRRSLTSFTPSSRRQNWGDKGHNRGHFRGRGGGNWLGCATKEHSQGWKVLHLDPEAYTQRVYVATAPCSTLQVCITNMNTRAADNWQFASNWQRCWLKQRLLILLTRSETKTQLPTWAARVPQVQEGIWFTWENHFILGSWQFNLADKEKIHWLVYSTQNKWLQLIRQLNAQDRCECVEFFR